VRVAVGVVVIVGVIEIVGVLVGVTDIVGVLVGVMDIVGVTGGVEVGVIDIVGVLVGVGVGVAIPLLIYCKVTSVIVPLIFCIYRSLDDPNTTPVPLLALCITYIRKTV
jgi:hypothetical protein